MSTATKQQWTETSIHHPPETAIQISDILTEWGIKRLMMNCIVQTRGNNQTGNGHSLIWIYIPDSISWSTATIIYKTIN